MSVFGSSKIEYFINTHTPFCDMIVTDKLRVN